jgi:hypothetical protein
VVCPATSVVSRKFTRWKSTLLNLFNSRRSRAAPHS